MQPPSPHDAQDSGRIMKAVLISLAIFLSYHFLIEKPQLEKMERLQQEQAKLTKSIPAPAAEQQELKPRTDVIAETKSSRIPIQGAKVTGSISLIGARIDDLSLNDQYTTVYNTKHIDLLSPSGTQDAYYVEGGWTSDDKTAVLPDEKTVWALAPGSAKTLNTGGSVTLRWDNGHGLLFERDITLDENYLFKVTQRVTNKASAEVKLNAWHLISRHSLPADFKGLADFRFRGALDALAFVFKDVLLQRRQRQIRVGDGARMGKGGRQVGVGGIQAGAAGQQAGRERGADDHIDFHNSVAFSLRG